MLKSLAFLSVLGGGLMLFAQSEPPAQNPPVLQTPPAPTVSPGPTVFPGKPAYSDSSEPETSPSSASYPGVASRRPVEPQVQGGLKQRVDVPPPAGALTVERGTRVLLNMINSVSTKQAQVGDRIYLETAFPVIGANHIIVPQGSWVTGTVTEVTRPARMKGRGALQVRFDSLTLPNGVTRNFRSDLGALDGRSNQDLNREQSKIKGPGDKMGDAETVMTTTVTGAGIGALAGVARGAGAGSGGLIGAAAGAALGMAVVMLSRGPDATLLKGSSVELITDRQLTFLPSELDFSNVPPRAALSEGSQTPAPQRRTLGSRFPAF